MMVEEDPSVGRLGEQHAINPDGDKWSIHKNEKLSGRSPPDVCAIRAGVRQIDIQVIGIHWRAGS